MFDEDFLLTMTEVERDLDNLQKCCYQVAGEQQGPWLRYYCCKYATQIQSVGVQWVSEEHAERFHQGTKEMERRYHGRWNVNL
jgi:hypothetical protein